MRNSWIISFAAVCGVSAFVYTLATGTTRRGGRNSWPTSGGGAIASTTRANSTLPQTIEGLEEAIEQNERQVRSGRAHFELARRYHEAGRADDATRAWEQAAQRRAEFVKTRPESTLAWFELGWSLWKLGRLDEAGNAMGTAEELLTHIPHGERDDDMWRMLGWARKVRGQDQEAIIAWARARDYTLERTPAWSDGGLYNLACYQALVGEREAALATLAKSVAAGWNDRARALHDEDLASIRDEARFVELLERMKQNPTGTRFGPD